MNWSLVVYEEPAHYDAEYPEPLITAYGNGHVRHYYSRLRSRALKSESKIDAYNAIKNVIGPECSIVHVELLD